MYGIWLDSSSNNKLRDNHMTDNQYNFGVGGLELSDFINDVDSSNTVDGKLVCYWVNRQDEVVPADAGYVAVVNSTDITVENLDLKNNGQGILLAYSKDSTIYGNNITKNDHDGISLIYSSYNIMSGNNITNTMYGIWLHNSSNNTISGNNITANNVDGIWLDEYSNYNSISGNHITNNGYGILLSDYSNYNSMYGNNITKNYYGIGLHSNYCDNNSISANTITANLNFGIELRTYNNTISENTIKNNFCGIWLFESSNNSIYHNNFVMTAYTDPWGRRYQHVYTQSAYPNFWDDGYPSGGNYWSNYTGVDSDHDGIGDSSHILDADNQDNYPLMGMFSDFPVIHQEEMMNETYKVFVNGTEVPCNLLPCSSSTHSYLYFTYNHSTQEVIVVPEFPTWTSMLLILVLLTVAIAIYKRRLLKIPIG